MRLRRLFAVITLVLAFASLGLPVDAAKASGIQRRAVLVLRLFMSRDTRKKDGTKVKAHDRTAAKPKATKSTTKTATNKAKSASTSSAAVVSRGDKGRIKRSEAARHAFEVQTGYPWTAWVCHRSHQAAGVRRR
jgi:hypothetical protein